MPGGIEMTINVNIEISEDGKIKIEPTGYKDAQCMTDLEALEAHLKKSGIKTTTTDQTRKAEIYAKNNTRARNYTR